MPTTCCVVNCHSKGSGIRFYRYPTDPSRLRQWLAFVSRQNPDGSPREPGDGDRVCSFHFTSGEKSNIPSNPDYVPSVLPGCDGVKGMGNTSLSRFERAQHRSCSSVLERFTMTMRDSSGVGIFVYPRLAIPALSCAKTRVREYRVCSRMCLS